MDKRHFHILASEYASVFAQEKKYSKGKRGGVNTLEQSLTTMERAAHTVHTEEQEKWGDGEAREQNSTTRPICKIAGGLFVRTVCIFKKLGALSIKSGRSAKGTVGLVASFLNRIATVAQLDQ